MWSFFLLSFIVGLINQNNLLENKSLPLVVCIPKLFERLFTCSHVEMVGSAPIAHLGDFFLPSMELAWIIK